MTDCTTTEKATQVLPVKPIKFYRDYRLYATWAVTLSVLCWTGKASFAVWSYLLSSLFFDWLILDLFELKESDILRKKGLDTFNGFTPNQFDRYAHFSKYARRGCFLISMIASIPFVKNSLLIDTFFFEFYGALFFLVTYVANRFKLVPCPFPEKIRVGGNPFDGQASGYKPTNFYEPYSSYSMRQSCLGY